jgi:hypothetical protein
MVVMRDEKMTLRDDLLAKIERMSDEEIAELAHYVETMQNDDLPLDYDPAKDPSIGFISGAVDSAMRVKEIAAEHMNKKFSQGENKS